MIFDSSLFISFIGVLALCYLCWCQIIVGNPRLIQIRSSLSIIDSDTFRSLSIEMEREERIGINRGLPTMVSNTISFQMMFMSFNSHTAGFIPERPSLPRSFNWVRVS
jgi:hypothetical protein